MLLSLDGTLFVQLVNFIVFLLILNVIFMKPVGAAIAKRRAFIDGIASDIAQFELDLKSLRTQAGDRVAAARRTGDARVAQTRAEAQNAANAIISDHQAQAAAVVDEAQATVGLEISQARSSESDVVESLARTMLERAVGPEVGV